MPIDPESSFELLLRAQAGDHHAVDKLLARYRPRLRRWASGRLPRYARAVADTDDLVQDALIGTFKNFKTFEHRGEWALQAYLRQAVSNRIRDELRRNDARPQHEALADQMPAAAPSPLEAAVGQQLFSRYEKALETLDADEREAVIARLELGCSYQEIAALIDRPSADAARMFVARVLAKLAAQMAEMSQSPR
jgi:RNA polymerase sigma factor (sigma-70 family)